MKVTPGPGRGTFEVDRKNPKKLEAWAEELRGFMNQERKPLEILGWLSMNWDRMSTPLTVFTAGMRALEEEAPPKDAHRTMRSDELFPVRVDDLLDYMEGKDLSVTRSVRLMVEVLNYHALSGAPMWVKRGLNPSQELMLERFETAVKEWNSSDLKVPPYEAAKAGLTQVKFDYGGEPVCYMEDLIASKVIACWPQVGEAAIQDAIRFVRPEVRTWLENPRRTLLPRDKWPEQCPKSRVRASDAEWELIVDAAVQRRMMTVVPEEDLLRDQHGHPVLNGAGAVRKVKRIGGEDVNLQRFISNLVPSNSYQEHQEGDDPHLPYLGQLSMLEIDEDEEILICSEDLCSCFNLFRVPLQWAGFFAFNKTVSGRLFGLPASQQCYVGMTVVPMGWLNSVAVMQTIVRTLIFGLSAIPAESEVSKLKWFPRDDAVSVVYLDSYDELRRVSKTCRAVLEGGPSPRHQRFVNTCNELELPLNEGKRVLSAVHGALQGGEFNGEAGTFQASKDKKANILGLVAAMLGSPQVSEFEIRHLVGKAIFAMAFRRPTMAFLEEIFVDMGKASTGTVRLSKGARDEVLTIGIVLPLLTMNLRAQMDQEVTITDASPTGGGGCVAHSFKEEPDLTSHDGERCFHCEKEFTEQGKFPCPTLCGASLCGLECQWAHKQGNCPRSCYMMPKFGERFSGPMAPLSHEVARVGGIEVQEPFDLKCGHDFFSDEGRQHLHTLEEDPHLAAEHWAPECRLFSRARGKPVKLPDGRVVPGPQPVRDEKHVMGFNWLPAHLKIALRKSNAMALAALKRGLSHFGGDRYVSIEHPWGSWLWWFALVRRLEEQGFTFAEGSACCFGGERVKWYNLLNNSPCLQQELHKPECPGHAGLRSYDVTYNDDGSLHFATEDESAYKVDWCKAYARGLKRQFVAQGWLQQAIQVGRQQKIWMELKQSTQRLQDEQVSYQIAGDLALLETNMRPGGERAHLKEMVRRTGIRGTDIKLCFTQDGLAAPYPAYRWLWRDILSYAWRFERHINEGEVAAFNVMLKRRAKTPTKHSMRYLAIVDSMVSQGAISKGRSPSKPLNRLLKQTAAYALGSDNYPLVTWTISRWNFADGASRRKTRQNA